MRGVESTLLLCIAVFMFAYGLTHATNADDFISGWLTGAGMVIAALKFFEDIQP